MEHSQTINTIAVCTAQVPFSRGGAEEMVDALIEELRKHDYEVELIQLPFKWYPREQLFKSIQAWELLDLTEADGKKIDLVIATKFPSYFVAHPNKVLWLIHQYRQAYDLLDSPYSGFDNQKPSDMAEWKKFVDMDTRVLKTYKRIYTISRNTSDRLKKYNNIPSTPLYQPPKLKGQYRNGSFGNYILSVGRLSALKRVDLLIHAMAFTDPKIKCKIAGTGPEMERLKNEAKKNGLENRIEFLGRVSDRELIDLYANCAFVFFAPKDEDYGFVTLEGFLSQKPVVTAHDSGGTLEFVEDNINGIVLHSLEEKEVAQKIDKLFIDKDRCRDYGFRGYQKVQRFDWDHVIKTLIHG